jgi:hypothetical protein
MNMNSVNYPEIATPTITLQIGNSTKTVELLQPVFPTTLVPYSKALQRALHQASEQERFRTPPGSRSNLIESIKLYTSEHIEPSDFGIHTVLMWLSNKQFPNQMTPEMIRQFQVTSCQDNSIGGRHLNFPECLRVHEALLVLDGENILEHQTLLRQMISDFVSNNVLTPANFAMLVHIFRANESLDMPLVQHAIFHVHKQILANQMPFLTTCEVYGTIIRSGVHAREMADIRKALIFHIDEKKITPQGLVAMAKSLCQRDSTLLNHALRVTINNGANGSAERLELDRQAAPYPSLVAAIKQLRAQKEANALGVNAHQENIYQGTGLPILTFQTNGFLAACHANT